MSREIKFRGRVKKDNLPQYKKGQIVYGYPVKGENTYIHTQEEFYSAVVSMGWNMCTSVVLVEDDVEQYTGVEDKAGKEIYEGDFVSSPNWKPNKMEVVFNRGGFCLKDGDESCYYPDIKYAEDMTVSGHIHEGTR